MKYITYVLYLLMPLDLKALAIKKCPDCMNILNCDSARATIFDNVQKIKEAFCGFNDLGTMVCCSYFADVNEAEIENHRNIKLLPNVCGKVLGNRIIGGENVARDEFPWMTLISSQSSNVTSFHCAGTIINSRYILPTASCIVNKNIIGARIGDFNLETKIDCEEGFPDHMSCESHIQDIPAEETIYHEKYEGFPAYNYDIGLIRLASPIDFSYQNAAPVCLPTTRKLYNISITKERATVTGWGLSDKFIMPSVLKKRYISVYTESECIHLNRSLPVRRVVNFGHNQYCSRSLDDSCFSDSGSPLLIDTYINDDYKYTQYGIMTHSPPDCRKKVRTMYTAIPPYIPWILDHIKE